MNRALFTAIAVTASVVIGSVGTRADESGDGLRVNLSPLPGRIRTGEAVALTLDIRDHANKPVGDLPIVHERPIHLIIVPADLLQMAHLHPGKFARGLYRTTYVFPRGGKYRVFVDLKSPRGTPLVVPFTLLVQGDTLPAAPPETALSQGDIAEAGGLRAVRTSPHRITAGVPVELGMALTDLRTGGPVNDLEPYLGSMAHVIIISSDTEDFLHAHAMEGGVQSEEKGHSEQGIHAHHAGQTTAQHAGATTLMVHTMFPRSGVYRIWMQVQRKGRVITLPFTVNVPG